MKHQNFLQNHLASVDKLFTISAADQETHARAGEITTAHGKILTPVFMPVGTRGTVKAVHQHELLEEIGAQIILANTYHLYLKPGTEVIEKAGGIHKFISWNRPILTDSGGYQIFSLADERRKARASAKPQIKISEEGVQFFSDIDGSSHFFTPEKVIDLQSAIGGDMIMAFDECAPYPCQYAYAKESMELTHRWLKRCIKRMEEIKKPILNPSSEGVRFGTPPRVADQREGLSYPSPSPSPSPFPLGRAASPTESFWRGDGLLFPIVQGSVYKDLRIQSAEFIAQQNCEGNAIGGLSVGEPQEEMFRMTEEVCAILPKEKPRYLMGVGTPGQLLECIALGIDMFDCVMPTRNARNGQLFTKNGTIAIRNRKWREDFSVIDEEGSARIDKIYSKAYLRHLNLSDEMLASQIASIHNLAFYMELFREARKKIMEGTFRQWKDKMAEAVSRRL